MRQIKTPIAGKVQSTRYSQSTRFAHGPGPADGAGFSQFIAKIGDATMRHSELAQFNKQMLIHELIRGSLVLEQQENTQDGANSSADVQHHDVISMGAGQHGRYL